MAIGVHQIGMLSKLFTEELESMDEKLIESMDAVGQIFGKSYFMCESLLYYLFIAL